MLLEKPDDNEFDIEQASLRGYKVWVPPPHYNSKAIRDQRRRLQRPGLKRAKGYIPECRGTLSYSDLPKQQTKESSLRFLLLQTLGPLAFFISFCKPCEVFVTLAKDASCPTEFERHGVS